MYIIHIGIDRFQSWTSYYQKKYENNEIIRMYKYLKTKMN